MSDKSALQKRLKLQRYYYGMSINFLFTLHSEPKVRWFCAHQGLNVSVQTLKPMCSKVATVVVCLFF